MRVVRNDNYDWIVTDDSGVQIGTLDHNGEPILFSTGPGGPAEVTLVGVQTLSNKTLASPAFTGAPTGLTKAAVGLSNVANLAPPDLPVSDATQLALNAKPNLQSGALASSSTLATSASSVLTALAEKQAALVAGTNIKTINGISPLGAGNIDVAGGSGGLTDTAFALAIPLDLTNGREMGAYAQVGNLTLTVASGAVLNGNCNLTLVRDFAFTLDLSAFELRGSALPTGTGKRLIDLSFLARPNGLGGLVAQCFVSPGAVVPSAPVFSASTPPDGTVGVAYSYTYAASNTTSFAVTAGALPAGLSLNTATGAITGTPTTAATTAVTVSATGPGGTTADNSESVTIAPALSGRVDTFNRADAATPGTPSDGGSPWTVGNGSCEIVSNRLKTTNIGVAVLDTGVTTYTFTVTVDGDGGGEPFLLFRRGVADTNDFRLKLYSNSNHVVLFKQVATVETVVLETTNSFMPNGALAAPIVVAITVTPTQITGLTIDGVTPSFITGSLPITDSLNGDGTIINLVGGFNSRDNFFENFSVVP